MQSEDKRKEIFAKYKEANMLILTKLGLESTDIEEIDRIMEGTSIYMDKIKELVNVDYEFFKTMSIVVPHSDIILKLLTKENLEKAEYITIYITSYIGGHNFVPKKLLSIDSDVVFDTLNIIINSPFDMAWIHSNSIKMQQKNILLWCFGIIFEIMDRYDSMNFNLIDYYKNNEFDSEVFLIKLNQELDRLKWIAKNSKTKKKAV